MPHRHPKSVYTRIEYAVNGIGIGVSCEIVMQLSEPSSGRGMPLDQRMLAARSSSGSEEIPLPR